jgi:hypothetical protein
MPASLPGDTAANNRTGNPSAGLPVLLDPLSGPKGSPLDRDSTGNASTGGLCTGLGFGASVRVGPVAPQSLAAAGFNDEQVPGTKPAYLPPPPAGTVGLNTTDSTMLYIAGGRMQPNPDPVAAFKVPYTPKPYTVGVALCAAGNGAARDGGAGPVFTGFAMKAVTASADVANGAAVESGFANRSGATLKSGASTFGVATAALAAPA